MKRIVNLDVLRIFACLGVIGLHSFDQSVGLLNRIVYMFCSFSVPVFFMISGYTLLSKENASVSYAAKKILALIRIVLLWDVVKYCLYFFISLRIGTFDNGSWIIPGFIKDAYSGLLQEGTHWHFWYLGTLMIIYLVIPILNRICKNNKVLIVLWAVLLVVCTVIQILSYINGKSLQREVRQTFRLWTAFQYLLLGGIIARFKDSIFEIIKKVNGIVLYGFITVIWVSLMCIYVKNGMCDVWAECYYDDLIAIVWNALLFIVVFKVRFSERIAEMVVNLSPLTFGMYIVHPLILDIQSRYLHATNFVLSIVQYIVLITASIIGVKILLKICPKLVKL